MSTKYRIYIHQDEAIPQVGDVLEVVEVLPKPRHHAYGPKAWAIVEPVEPESPPATLPQFGGLPSAEHSELVDKEPV